MGLQPDETHQCHSLIFIKSFPYRFSICRATNTPLAEAWDSEWVTPLPSPIMYSPLYFVSKFSSKATSML